MRCWQGPRIVLRQKRKKDLKWPLTVLLDL
ncbi:hypothetical protein GGQ85_003329 [Nitrobacter vulgaris]|nr:hypothetical protein [Nitrobacter vulgaris]